ncbi:MAG: CDC48 family AAA ATPase [Chloroflexi bacterium]|nr:CDC48 family AAA ATPase [Chloroflexota bacterium]
MTEDTASLRVTEASAQESGRGLARLAPPDLERLGAAVGDVLAITGRRTTVAIAMRTYVKDAGRGTVELDAVTRSNAGARVNDTVTVRRVASQPATRLVLQPTTALAPGGGPADPRELRRLLHGVPVVAGDKVRVAASSDFRAQDLLVVETQPEGPVVVDGSTAVDLQSGAGAARGGRKIVYRDVGGLGSELDQIREVIELPLRFPEVFERLGIDPPKGVLLHGPPGTGKTLIARAVANETNAHFVHINGPEIVHRYYGDSEAHLRELFQEARDHAPSVVFLDEIDAIAPKREDVFGEVEKRVVAQLMALMDGLESRGQVVVIAATNIPDALDPALRRPGRFDREIRIRVPDRQGRLEILRIHSRDMPLAPDVDLARFAEITHGHVGADLEALCREAAMIALRRSMAHMDLGQERLRDEDLGRIVVANDDFTEALSRVKPSGIREAFTEVADVSWEEIGGLEEVKRRLQEAIEWPLKYAPLFEEANTRPPKGILLAGAPGTGKTLLARAVATESGVNFISIKGPQILSKWVGESERGVREVFQRARLATPCILFFDELDALAPHRGSLGDSQVGDRVVGQLLAEMEGVEELAGVVVLAATNRLDMVDPALLSAGRFEVVIELPVPDRAGRLAVLKIHARGKPLADDVNLETLADLTDGWVGGDLAALCRRATMMALREHVDRGAPATSPFTIYARHFRAALDELRQTRRRLAPLPPPAAPLSNGPGEQPSSVVPGAESPVDVQQTATRRRSRPARPRLGG